MNIDIETVSLPLTEPFAITGHLFSAVDALRVTIHSDQARGRGEAMGSYYLNESSDSMTRDLRQIDILPNVLGSGTGILDLMPACGARNALDAAIWDYRAKAASKTIWQLVGISRPKTLKTLYTLGIAEPDEMAERAHRARAFPQIKAKLDAHNPIEALEAIRSARPDATLVIDVNQGWSAAELLEYLPHCQRLGIEMIEQPLPRGADEALEAISSPIPLCCDESCLSLMEFEVAARRYQVLNIKLDKCGGLTEGLLLVQAAQRAGMDLMVGNMSGSSLSMAPAYVIGQFCKYVDIDGPLMISEDVPNGLTYQQGGFVSPPTPALWG